MMYCLWLHWQSFYLANVYKVGFCRTEPHIQQALASVPAALLQISSRYHESMMWCEAHSPIFYARLLRGTKKVVFLLRFPQLGKKRRRDMVPSTQRNMDMWETPAEKKNALYD